MKWAWARIWSDAARRVTECIPTRISVGRLLCTNGSERSRIFLLMAGIGLDAQIVYNLNRAAQGALRASWPIGSAASSLVGRQLDEFEVVVDGRRISCSFALISKVRNYGGDLEIARSTSLLDDRFEVVLFEGRSSWRYLKYLARVAVGKLAGVQGVSVIRSTEACMTRTRDVQRSHSGGRRICGTPTRACGDGARRAHVADAGSVYSQKQRRAPLTFGDRPTDSS